MLDEDEARELRLHVAHRVSELYGPGRPAASLNEATLTAKGEWLLEKLSVAPNSIGARVLHELVADFYGVRLSYGPSSRPARPDLGLEDLPVPQRGRGRRKDVI